MKKYISICLAVILFGCPQTKNDASLPYVAGFKIIRLVDRSRIYKPGTGTSDKLHFRPIDIDIWYPAEPPDCGSTLLFRDILGLLEKRTKYYTASDAGSGIAGQIAKSLCEGFKCSDTAKLLNFKTESFKDALPVETKFPLVIYLCAYNGMSFENFALFEALAKKGFVVISISSIGRYPGDMTMQTEDLLEQVDDATASLHLLKQRANINFLKIGIIGYSWGGVSGAVLANRIPKVTCLISLDGSEFHHYGEAKDENSDFNNTRNSAEFKNMRLSVPYLRLESSLEKDIVGEDSVYNFSEKLTGEKFIFKIDSARHEDFSCLAAVVRTSGSCEGNQYFNTISTLVTGFLDEHLKNINSFSQIVAREINKTIMIK